MSTPFRNQSIIDSRSFVDAQSARGAVDMVIDASVADRRMNTICETFAGGELEYLNETEDFAAPLAENSIVVSFHPSARLRRDLLSNRFIHIQEYSILPDRVQPRWLLPVKKSVMLNGLKLYAPFSIKGRLFKCLITGLIRFGWKGLSSTKILLASRKPLPLQALVSEITGELDPEFAVSLGNIDQFHALVVQAMRRNGDILGYIKLPLTDAAAKFVRNEAKALEYLWEQSSGAMCDHIPRLLYSGERENDFILFQSSGPGKPGPQRFGKMHAEFLGLLEQVTFADKPGCQLVEELDREWQDFAQHMDANWRQLGHDALWKAGQLLGTSTLRCGLVHGDFAPWNTRQEDDHLFVFDWESAKWGRPTIWDVFRFHERTSVLLNEKHVSYPDDLKSTLDRASFLLYCVQSVLEIFDSEERHAQIKSQYYQNQILRCLSRPM